MRKLMESSYPEIWIEGELSSLSKPASGHYYFSLKDDQSQLRCAMFKNRAAISRYQPRSGDLVRVRAKISVYTARGDLQCIVQHIEEAGVGVLQRRFEELQLKLSAAGLFAAQHKQQIPEFPSHIGLITSPTGAAVRDVLTTLQRRNPGIPITIYPALVQGDGAAASIQAALSAALQHQRCDVLVLTRGGGSMEDLWCFNDESLAQAIFASSVPIISAVGHEVDVTIADYVADLRAPTPTAAAELLSPDQTALLQQVLSSGRRLQQSWRRMSQELAQRVDLKYSQLNHPQQALKKQHAALQSLSGRLSRATQVNLQQRSKQLDFSRVHLLRESPRAKLIRNKEKLMDQGQNLRRAQRLLFDQKKRLVGSFGEQLDLVSPLAVLSRGYAITRDAQNAIIRNAAQVNPGQNITVQLHSGNLDCAVTSTSPTTAAKKP